jgi:hypothetical protein
VHAHGVRLIIVLALFALRTQYHIFSTDPYSKSHIGYGSVLKITSWVRIHDSTVLLLVSICTDAMIKLVAMHPEVWFMDVTASVNKQKSDLFMLAIRTPSGRTFPGNFTFIPSGKAWVFHCIYQYAFTSLFGKTVCSYNQLALFDDDLSERAPFEKCIATLPHFSKSTVMLCVFHAVWMPFREVVTRFITARFHDSSGGLTMLGRKVGKCSFMMM